MDDWILKVPANVVAELRDGLHSLLGQAARDVSVATYSKERACRPERYREPLECFDRTRALLDLVGWGAPGRPSNVLLDVREHGWALITALETALVACDAELQEMIPEDRTPAEQRQKDGDTILREFVLREYLSAVDEHLARLVAAADST